MTWACCVWERVSVHGASLVAGAWESQCAWIWLRLTGEIWNSFNWPDCKGVKISHPVMRWHVCLWTKSHGGTHTCETDHTLAHICETKHAPEHMSMCLWNQSHVGIHVYEMDHALAHTSVKLVTHWHTGFLRQVLCIHELQLCVHEEMPTFMWMLSPLGKWCGACFFSLLWIWTISLSPAFMCLLLCPLSC